MKKRFASLTLAALALGTALLVGCSAPPSEKAEGKEAAAKPEGQTIAQTLEQAKKENKLALITFSAEWCGPCHMLHDSLKDIRLEPYMAKVVHTTIDIDDEANKAELKEYYPDEGIPYTIVLRPDGSRVTDQTGFESTTQFAAFLKGAMEKAKS